MRKFDKNSIVTGIVIVTVAALVFPLVGGFAGPSVAQAATAPNLGVADGYSVFGNAGITETAGQTSHLWGNVGDNGLGHASLIASQVDGTLFSIAQPTVVSAISFAYGDLADEAQTGAINLAASPSVGPGVYDVAATAFNSTLTLNGAGVYIFRSTSSIAQTAGGTMLLTNGATACNVFWQIPTSMTFAAAGNIEGTIITNTGLISFVSGVSLKGRAWAATQVTMNNNQITEPTCATSLGGHARGVYAPLPTTYSYVPPVPPLISVTKVPTPLALPAGPGSVTYNYDVMNIGLVAMSNVKVTDDKSAIVDFISGDTNGNLKLDTNETWKYRSTTTLSQTTTNIVTATGEANGLIAVDIAEATVVVGASTTPPLINVIKKPNVFTLPVGGGAVTYTYTVTNPGTAPLSDVSITDNKCTGLPSRVVGHPGDLNKNNLLESNEAWTFTCQTNLKQTTTNIGTAQGSANGLTITDFALATVVVATPKLPNTGIAPDEKSTPWNVVILTGIFAALFYSARKKQTA